METIWRIQLKPSPREGITYENVLSFCREENIIGVGWEQIICKDDDYTLLKKEIEESPYEKKISTFRSINAMRMMRPGDLIWTRLGQDASEYYLCRVGNKIWKDRVITERHYDHNIIQFVSAKWIKIGKEDHVPGKVINSFIPAATVQRISDVTEVSKYIWNHYCDNIALHYNDVKERNLWDVIGSEDLECLVLLYLQCNGYYIISSTLKKGTGKYEVAMISHDGTHRCYPQVKRVTPLPAENYAQRARKDEKIVLFTTSERYGEKKYPNVECLTKKQLEHFMRTHYSILPDNVKYWVELSEFK